MDLLIREATQDDVKTISQIGVASWQAAYRGLIPDEYLDSLLVETREKYISKSLGITTNKFAIAEADGQPVGMICFYPLSNGSFIEIEWELEALYLLPNYWNKGIGRTLIKYAFQYMVLNKAIVCKLWVLKGNQRARKFYESVGMSFSGIEKTITIGGKDLIEVNYQINF